MSVVASCCRTPSATLPLISRLWANTGGTVLKNVIRLRAAVIHPAAWPANRLDLTLPIATASAAADIEGQSKAAKFSQQGRLNSKLDYFTRFSGCKTASANLSHSAGISRSMARYS
jgi:hypothetical protein